MSPQAKTGTRSYAAVWLMLLKSLYCDFFGQVPRTLQMGCVPFTG